MLKYGPTSYIYYPHVERKNVVSKYKWSYLNFHSSNFKGFLIRKGLVASIRHINNRGKW